MERLTAAEVVEELRARERRLLAESDLADDESDDALAVVCKSEAVATAECRKLIEQHLVPQWQDEPTGDGWYWVDGVGIGAPCWVELTDDDWFADNGKWSLTWHDPNGSGGDYRPLNGRRVCPVSGPPSEAKEVQGG